jgi:hypothetical protein
MSSCSSFLLDFVSDKISSNQDRYHAAIVDAAATLKQFNFKDLYPLVCKNLGATEEQINKGIAPCPYTGELKDCAKLKGLIRSWVEERSPHSRQYYFRGGKRAVWTAKNPRPLLFVNEKLGAVNAANEWMPYTTARGDFWEFNPDRANSVIQPTDEMLDIAAAAYKKKGMRGKCYTNCTADVTVVTREISAEKVIRTAAAASAVVTATAAAILAF